MTRSTPIRVRWLAPYPTRPARNGGQIRVSQLILGLERAGAEVQVTFPTSCAEQVMFGTHDGAYRARNRDTVVSKLRCALSPLPDYSWLSLPAEPWPPLEGLGPPADIIVLSQPHQFPMVRRFATSSTAVLLEAQNVESDLYRQLTAASGRTIHTTRMRLETLKSRRFEAAVLRDAEHVVAVSDLDASRLRRMGAKSVSVVANGVDTSHFTRQEHDDVSRGRLIMTGTLGYKPNEDAAAWLAREILPAVRRRLPAATLALVGSHPSDVVKGLHDPLNGVSVHANVDDVRRFTADSDIFLVPLRLGSGTPLKVAEALACGIPTVCTSRIEQALRIDDGSVDVADSAEEFADAVSRIVSDPAHRGAMVEAGYRLVAERFDWRVLSAQFADTVLNLAESSRGI